MFSVQGIQLSIFTSERSCPCSLWEGWHSHVMRGWNPTFSSASLQWGAEWWMERHPLLQKNSCYLCFSLAWHQFLGLPKSSCCLLAQIVADEEDILPERSSKDWKIPFCFISVYEAEMNPLLAITWEMMYKRLATNSIFVNFSSQLTWSMEYYIVTRITARIWQPLFARWRLSSLQNCMVALDMCDNEKTVITYTITSFFFY